MEIVRKLILTNDEVFVIANAEAGRLGTLLVLQDNVGGHNLTLPHDDGYNGFITLDKTPNAITIIKWIVSDNIVYVYTEGSGFNIVPVNGSNGSSFYTWIVYADNATGTLGFSVNPLGKKYMGVAYNKLTPVPSTNPTEYAWSQIKGSDGIGQDGTNGQNGRDGIDGLDGTDGSQGIDGQDGRTTYFHVAYADSLDGSLNFNQSSGAFIGTYVDYTQADSTNYLDYRWARFAGLDGIPGTNGANGETSYLHIKYSNDAGITFTGNNGEFTGDYIGQYVDFIQADSSNPAMYKWSKIKGDKGDIGNEGLQGRQGAYITFDGDFNSGKQYTKYEDRIVAVKYGEVYYSTNVGTGNIPVGTLPTDINHWKPLNSYANIATDILLAQDAYLAKLESKNIYIGDGTSGWVFSQGSIKSIQTNPNGTARTSLTSDGRLFANNADITGNINASSGSIGGIVINQNGISAPNFSIDNNGIANFTNASITGAINATSGSIGGFTFNSASTGLNGEKIVVDGSVGAIWKNQGLADVRGGQLYIPLYTPASMQDGSMWLSDTISGGGQPNPGGGSGGGSLSQLADVLLASPTNGQALVYNGSKWVNKSVITDLSGLGSLAYRNNVNGNEVYTNIGDVTYDGGISQYLRWRNYGNGHIIFDASSGISPTGVAINNTNPANVWSPSYPNLMGWNGQSTYGVRVYSSQVSDDSSKWGGTNYSGTERFSTPMYLMSYQTDTNHWQPTSYTAINTMLGINTGGFLTNSVTGSATKLQVLEPFDRDAGNVRPNETPLQVRFDFVRSQTTNTNGNYAGLMTFSPWVGTTASTGDGSYQLAFGSSAANATGVPLLNIRSGIETGWNQWHQIYHTGLNQHFQMRNTGGGTAFNNGTLELQSSNSPVLGFHHEGVVASTIGIETSGRIVVRNNPGNAYENFAANHIQSFGQVTASQGTDGGFTNIGYNTGHNNIWRLNNAVEYGLGYYQGAVDYTGFHFGNRNAPQHTFDRDGVYSNNGRISVANNANHDPYGVISVTRATDQSYSYYGMTRAGSIGIGMGISTSNQFIIGGGSVNAGAFNSIWFSLDSGGNAGFGGSVQAINFRASNDISALHVYANNLLVLPTINMGVENSIWIS